jgi:hypothetical protein
MRWYQPGEVARGEFTTADPTTGAATDADSTPTVSVARNGTADGAVSVTVTSPATGRYLYSFTVPADYDAGDHVAVRVTATVGGVTVTTTALETRLVGTDWAADTVAATAAAGLAVSLDGYTVASHIRSLSAAILGPRVEGPANTWTYYAQDAVTPRVVAVFDGSGLLLTVSLV